jgi:hypothetical protein
MYPAPLVHIIRFFLRLHPIRISFISSILLVATGLTAGFVQILRREGLTTTQSVAFAGTTAFLSYPLMFLIQRWNIEFVVWLVGTLAVWCFFTGRTTLSAVLIGIAASLKLYPFIFLGLFLPRRKYRDFGLGIVTFFIVTLVSLYAIGPTIAQAARWDSEQIAAFSKYFVGSLWGLGYDHSFFALVKFVTLPWHPNYFIWARPYSVTMAAISVALYFGRMWRLPLPNQILALSVLSVTLAPVSFDYTLLNLYPAFAMLAVLAIQAERRGSAVPDMTAYMVLFALILTPESYVIYHAVRYGAELRSVCLIVMLVLALKTPLPEALPRTTEESVPLAVAARAR